MDSERTQAVIDLLVTFFTSYGLRILAAIIILIVGKIVAGMVGKMVRRAMTRGQVDESLIGFVAGLAKGGVMVFAVLAMLAKLGVQTTSFVAVLGAAGLAVGLALQGSLANFAAGVLILMFRPYRIGDVIDAAGSKGKVQEIGILATTLATPDNQKVIMPNGAVMKSTIVNVNAFPTRRVDLVASISYGDDLDRAREILRGIVDAHPQVLKDPPPVVEVLEMADSSVNIVVRPWVNTPDYWDVYFALTRSIKLELERSGLSIPFPQRDVHLLRETATAD